MNFRLVITFFLFSIIGISQTKGTISGTLTDKDLNNEALPFANILIKNTKIIINK